MLIKKGKTNWPYIFIVAFLAVIVFGSDLFFRSQLSEDLAAQEIFMDQKIIKKPTPEPAPMPREINPNFLTQINECFIPTAEIYGYTLRITSDFRSLDEQTAIYDLGRTEDGRIVSWATAGSSIHNYGYAVDVVDRWRGYYVNWKRLAKIGEFCGFAQVDDAHFEHRGGLVVDQFKAGERPLPLALPCAIMGERAKAQQALTAQDLQDCGVANFFEG